MQSASLATIDSGSHILVRLARAIGQNEFIKRYGDSGAEEFDDPDGGTIPQRLLMMNGKLVDEKTKDSLLANAATQIASLAPDDATAVETAHLAVLSRRPSADERDVFRSAAWPRPDGSERTRRMGDLYWTLAQQHGVLMEPLSPRPSHVDPISCTAHVALHRRAVLKLSAGLGGAAWLTSVAHVLARARDCEADPAPRTSRPSR